MILFDLGKEFTSGRSVTADLSPDRLLPCGMECGSLVITTGASYERSVAEPSRTEDLFAHYLRAGHTAKTPQFERLVDGALQSRKCSAIRSDSTQVEGVSVLCAT